MRHKGFRLLSLRVLGASPYKFVVFAEIAVVGVAGVSCESDYTCVDLGTCDFSSFDATVQGSLSMDSGLIPGQDASTNISQGEANEGSDSADATDDSPSVVNAAPSTELVSEDTSSSDALPMELVSPAGDGDMAMDVTGDDDASDVAVGIADASIELVPGCGNGHVEDGEDCDSGELNNDLEVGVCNTSCRINQCANGAARPCAEGGALGNCATGTQTCVNGGWGECSVAALAQDSCQPLDDATCNGLSNEGCECTAGESVSCAALGEKGACALGLATCGVDGRFGACSVQPGVADSCTAIGDDSNCNGVPNEDCDCSPEGAEQPCGPATDEGECVIGVSVCSDGKWGACSGAKYPQPRDCTSTQDNDCDGSPDNTVDETCACPVGESQACGEHPGLDGNGQCRAGQRVCVGAAQNGSSRWSSVCTGSVGPAGADSCTVPGDDSDCNGESNSGCECLAGQSSTCGERWGYQGQCADYVIACSNGGVWPSESSSCSARGSDSCAAPGECIGGVWGDDAVFWGGACWQ